MEELLRRSGFTLVECKPYVHSVRLYYLITKLAAQVGWKWRDEPGRHRWLDRIILPVYLGDVKIFIARKTELPA